MSVYKRGPVYWCSFSIGGQQIRTTTRTSDRKKAEDFEARLRAKLIDDFHAHKTGRKPKRTFDEALVKWLEGEARALKSYDSTINHARHVTPFTLGLWLEDIPEAAQRMTSAMLDSGLKPATINQRLAIVRRVLNLCYQWNWTDVQLGAKVKLLRTNNARNIYLTAGQVERLAELSGEASDAILLLAYTGLRRSELFRLGSANKVDGRLVIPSETKNGRPRIVPLPARVADVAIPITITMDMLRARFEKARLAIGMPHLHLHDLRHTYASLLIQAGAPLAAVSKLLGHAHLGVTSIYAHLADRNLDDAVSVLDVATKGAKNS